MGKTHVIDGVTYVEVDRKAEVGEKVIVVNNGKSTLINNGDTFTVKEREYDFGVWTEEGRAIFDSEYRVLEPLETVNESQASPEVIDMLANLARRVTQLESQLLAAQNNLEKQSYELENAKHRISKHVDRFGAVEEKVEMLTDDVITLDERSQILSAINKYYAEGSR